MISSLPLPFRLVDPFSGREFSSVSTFTLMLVAAMTALVLSFRRSAEERGLDRGAAHQMLQILIVGSFAGAKLGFVLEVYREIWIEGSLTLAEVLFTPSGLVFYGSLFVTLPLLWIYIAAKRLSPGEYGDALAPALALGYAVGRLGCMISGDGCFGYEAPWRLPPVTMVFGFGSVVPTHGVNVWNTPLIESAASFLFYHYSRKSYERPGTLLPLFLLYNGVVRFLVEFLRHNEPLIPLFSPPLLPSGHPLDYERAIREGFGAAYYFRHWYWYGFTQSQLGGLLLAVAGGIWIFLTGHRAGTDAVREHPAPPGRSSPS